MNKRMTDERLAVIVALFSDIDRPWYELTTEYLDEEILEALKTERAEVERLRDMVKRVKALPGMWLSCNESRHDPNNLIICADELKAALNAGKDESHGSG